MIFVFTSVIAFFTMLFWQAGKWNEELERKNWQKESTKTSAVFQNSH